MNTPQSMLDRRGRVYTPAVSPRLKKLLAVIFAVVALLGANSVYLVAITVLGEAYQNQFYMFMFLLHLLLGLAIILPFLFFAFGHLATAFGRPNRKAVRAGIALLTVSIVLTLSGLVLVRFEGFAVRDPKTRSVAYWAHVICPLLAIALYVAHRMAGPFIKWRWAGVWAGAVGVFVAAMAYLHHQDPRLWYAVGPKEGEKYYAPSAARTATGKFVPEHAMLMDEYCKKCHADAYEQHYQSVHHFSSFNNKPYLFSVNETRQVGLKRDGTVQASRWCAGCHDPVPFFTGKFDDPKYDIKNKSDPTTQAGITCVVCHGITNINSVTGNAAYTFDEPIQYPFAYSDNPVLQWINNQLVKAKPALHKKTFMKDDVHRRAEFCSTCHKVSLPYEVTHYKEWLRGQDHYNPFLLSGVSGHGSRSFYYPDKAKDRCADCHMPLKGSNDFGARDFDSSGTRKIHNHFFLGANTGLPFLRNYEMLRQAQGPAGEGNGTSGEVKSDRTNAAITNGTAGDGKTTSSDNQKKRYSVLSTQYSLPSAENSVPSTQHSLPGIQYSVLGTRYCPDLTRDQEAELFARLSAGEKAAFRKNEAIIEAHQKFLRDGQLRIDIFAMKKGGTIDGELTAPLRPAVPPLEPGSQYLVEVVLRTLKLGHLFTQGTIDSNEVWVDIEARSGDRVIGRSGAIDENGTVDPWSHFVNALVIDRRGDRIDRRNPQDIFIPVYNHQIPPGAGQVVHFLLNVPKDVAEPVKLTARLNYRKFDRKYMEHVFKEEKLPVPHSLPVTVLCEDTITLPIAGSTAVVENPVSKIPEWQRWNDYGIGLFLEGEQSSGSEKGELRQAEQVFRKVVELGQGAGYANLARIYLREKRLVDAVEALQAAAEHRDMFPAGLAGSGPGTAPGAAGGYVEPAPAWTIAWLTGLVNEQNGELDKAIGDFELLLSDEMHAAVANRGFDFRKDFVVWNELGIVRAERAEQERGPGRAAWRGPWIRQAIDAFEHTLAIDPEDLTAHFRLAELYGYLAGETTASGVTDEKPAAAEATRPSQVAASELRSLGEKLADAGRPIADRLADAQQLIRQIPAFVAGERVPFESRHRVLVELLSQARRVFATPQSHDSEIGLAVARVLRELHRELHQMYKPDDNAREAVALHRQKNPAANHAAQSIVIYPLDREGAPGLADSPKPDAVAAEAASGEE